MSNAPSASRLTQEFSESWLLAGYQVYQADFIFRFAHLAIQFEGNVLANKILTNDLLYDIIFDASSPANILRLSRTCRTAQAAVNSYIYRAFSVNRLLLRYFPEPLEFRSLQARTGALVSGSTALQFFNRAIYPDSDLDLYVSKMGREEVGRWVLTQGYQFKPHTAQDEDFEVAILKEEEELEDNPRYCMKGVAAIFTFVKPSERDPEKELKVQIIVGMRTPMEVIMNFHSSVVMNVISWDRAYCLYPRATLEKRQSLFLRPDMSLESDFLSKYTERGWEILYNLTQATSDILTSFPSNLRWIGDGRSWTMRLPVEGVTPPPPFNEYTPALTRDPCVCTAWSVVGRVSPQVAFRCVQSLRFRYTYVVLHRYMMYIEQAMKDIEDRFEQELRTQKDLAEGSPEPPRFLDEELIQYCASRLEKNRRWRLWR